MRQFRRFLIPPVTLFFCSIFILIALAQEKLPEIVKKIEPSTVVILTYGKDGKMIGQGSGFFISQSGDIITNRHVLTGVHRAEVKTARGKVYPITMIVAEDKEADIIRASVNIPKESVRPLSVSSSIPEVGERVAVIGSPLGLERTVSDGIVSAVREIPAFGKIYQITAPISPGSSGSPVVNMKGEVIGVATFQFVEGQNLNFAIPGERIAKLKTEKGKTLDQWKMDAPVNTFASEKSFFTFDDVSEGFGRLKWGHYLEKFLLSYPTAKLSDEVGGQIIGVTEEGVFVFKEKKYGKWIGYLDEKEFNDFHKSLTEKFGKPSIMEVQLPMGEKILVTIGI